MTPTKSNNGVSSPAGSVKKEPVEVKQEYKSPLKKEPVEVKQESKSPLKRTVTDYFESPNKKQKMDNGSAAHSTAVSVC